MKSRTQARAIALQALYEYDLSHHPVGIIMQNRFQEEELDEKTRQFAEEIILGVFPIIEQLDHIIASYAPERPLDQVASIDRNIIRIALWEFSVKKITPVKVAINEAVELAKVYGSDSTPRFINGVLGSLVAKYEEYRSEIENINK
jgi:N utilization substance protein B